MHDHLDTLQTGVQLYMLTMASAAGSVDCNVREVYSTESNPEAHRRQVAFGQALECSFFGYGAFQSHLHHTEDIRQSVLHESQTSEVNAAAQKPSTFDV